MDDFDLQETPIPRRTASRVPFVVGMIAMLCTGVVVGVVLEHTVFHPAWRNHDWRGGAIGFLHRGHPGGPRLLDDRMARVLSLTPAQRVQVDSIMAQSMRRVEQVQQQVRPQMRQIFTETHSRIDSVLTPEQRERLRTMFPPRDKGGAWREGPPGAP